MSGAIKNFLPVILDALDAGIESLREARDLDGVSHLHEELDKRRVSLEEVMAELEL